MRTGGSSSPDEVTTRDPEEAAADGLAAAEEAGVAVVVPPAYGTRDPLWARLAILFGVLVMAASGATVAVPRMAAAWFSKDIALVNAIPSELAGRDISGPINLLLLGMDQRNGMEAEDRIRADSIILVHIPADHRQIFMISIPRDSRVRIPAYPPTGYRGGLDKINSAFAMGALTPDQHRDPSPSGRARGAELTMRTISNLVPGGLTFNGAAIIDFEGFEKVLTALGGVRLCVDEEVYSIHYYDDGRRAPIDLDRIGKQKQGKHYPVGCSDMQPWEALDYARQRHIPDGDYGRQRHQQQLLKAVMAKVASSDTLTNLTTLSRLQSAAGELLTLDLGGNSLEDWVLTLSHLDADDIVMIKTNGGDFNSEYLHGTWYEYLSPESLELLRSVRDDTVLDFLDAHPDWVASDH